MVKKLALIALFAFAGCSSQRSELKTSWDSRDLTIGGRYAEMVVQEHIMANDPLVKNQRLWQPVFLSGPDGKGGAYIAMTSAFGNSNSCGPRYTWLYQVRGQKLERIFRYPFDAQKLTPGDHAMLQGDYWAYECLACDSPQSGYMAKIPVKVYAVDSKWKIVPQLKGRERERWAREARLVVHYGMEKYGANDPEARRMLGQLDRFFPSRHRTRPTGTAATSTPPKQS